VWGVGFEWILISGVVWWLLGFFEACGVSGGSFVTATPRWV